MYSEILKTEPVSRVHLERGVRNGSIVIVGSSLREVRPIAIGAGVKTKVNANVGTSPKQDDVNLELTKAFSAVDAGADTVMDLSVGVDVDSPRRRILRKVGVPVGTVPLYQSFVGRDCGDVSFDDILDVVEVQARDGVDFMTLHCGITLDLVRRSRRRLIPITSRGGSLIAAWMLANECENPLYTGFDHLLEILKEYGVVLSLGDALRPGATKDASDECQMGELRNLGRLTKIARKKGVQVIIEGPGHVPLDQIEKNVRLEKEICDNAPFYVLGPLVSDVGLGYDHITGAIGGALAALHGADFLCYVTPSEHLGLPTVEDVRDGVIASRIAAHAADMVKLGTTKRDDDMSRARRNLDWNSMFKLALDKRIKDKYPHMENKHECTMCGEYCALKVLEKQMKAKERSC
jgi:phosphomethylpyrimidine synthase